MLSLDSWAWLEYVFGGDAETDAKTILDDAHNGGAVTSTKTASVLGRRLLRLEFAAVDLGAVLGDFLG